MDLSLVKRKSDDLTEKTIYRAIAISTSRLMSKLFEHVVVASLHTAKESDTNQFGFKSGHSTALCTSVLNTHMLKVILLTLVLKVGG